LAGKAAEGKYSLVKYVYTIPGERNAQLVNEYRKRTNEAPPQEFLAGYTCTYIMTEAIKRAGGTDPEKLRSALEKTNYDGLNGNYRFDEKHQAYGFDLYLTQTQNGKPVVVKQVKVEKP
jgi:branched-chain amino acid transport system substrate-binding protein